MKTQWVESLTSYIARIAAAHHLFPGVLMEDIIAPLTHKKYSSANLHKIYSHTAALNGTGVMAEDLVNVFEQLTLQSNLRFLTLLGLSNLVPSINLLRRSRAWCPHCYHDWLQSGTIIYEPLLWSLNEVKLCSVHSFPLHQQCPHCHKANYPLAWRSRPGYCSICDKWLGSSIEMKIQKDEFISLQAQEWYVWINNSLEDLIACLPLIELSLSPQRIRQSLKTCVEQFTQGNIAQFARQIQVPKNSLWLWCQGQNLPSIHALLKICYFVKVSLIQFLTNELCFEHEQPNNTAFNLPPVQSQTTARTQSFNFDKVKQDLEAILANDEFPPPSMEEVARRLGCQRRTIYKNFKELSNQISARYICYRKAAFENEVEKSCQQVRCVAQRLCEEGYYPSEVRVAQQLDHPGYLRYKRVRETLMEVQRNISL
ncbi:MAG: TniQ family protein [Aulosira sp. ZfuVER01]|nr:TniQ family protein [Aulosira sp. ZfuVER01]MDZ7997714.1 TniQ family protein [Aulosira sp. DedVER01a]MDZ8052209.1 TniQ family protein [Aulosira sp. ZfuCHP01]